MKRKIAAILSTIALAVTTTGLLTPAAHAATGTITVNISSQTCKYTASNSGGYARATNGSPKCQGVRAKLSYISAGGTVYTTVWDVGGNIAQWQVPSGTSYFAGWTGGLLTVTGTEVWKDQKM